MKWMSYTSSLLSTMMQAVITKLPRASGPIKLVKLCLFTRTRQIATKLPNAVAYCSVIRVLKCQLSESVEPDTWIKIVVRNNVTCIIKKYLLRWRISD